VETGFMKRLGLSNFLLEFVKSFRSSLFAYDVEVF